MKRYNVATPDGQTLTIEGPDDATDDELIGAAQAELNRAMPNNRYSRPVVDRAPQDVARQGEAGWGDALDKVLGLNFTDEAVGAGAAIGNGVRALFGTEDFHPVDTYNAYSQAERDRVGQYTDAHPRAALGATIVGSLGTGGVSAGQIAMARLPSLASRMLAQARLGAGLGAANGLGEGVGAGRIDSTVRGAEGGAILGAGLPVLGSLVGKVANSVVGMLGSRDPSRVAGRLVANAIADDRVTPREAGRAMDQARTAGVPRMLADTGDATRRLLGSVARQPGPARTMVREALTTRQAGQGARVIAALERNLGPTANPRRVGQRILEQARKTAAPLYDRAYAAPAVGSPEIDNILITPAGRAAISRARTIAANERRNPEELGFRVDANGEVGLNPVRADLFSAHAQARNELQEAQLAYKAARVPGANRESALARVEAARQAVRDADAALSAAPSSGTAATTSEYSPQTLDYVKRGLDDQVEQFRNPVTRRLELDEAGRAVNGVRADFLREADRLNPDYAAARAAYAGPAQANEALYRGEAAINNPADDIARELEGMSPDQSGHFGLGYRSRLVQRLNAMGDGHDKTRVFSSPERRASIAAANPDGNVAGFTQALQPERDAFETYRVATGGSPTSVNLADDALLGEATNGQGLQAVGNAFSGRWASAAKNIGATVMDPLRYGFGQAGQRTRQQLASLLTESDRSAFERSLDVIERDFARVQSGRRVGRAISNVTAATGSRLPAQGYWPVLPDVSE